LISLSYMKIASAVVVFLVTILAGVYPFRRAIKRRSFEFPVVEALASGVFLGAGLLHMLGSSSAQWTALGVTYPMAFLLAGGMFLLLLLMEHIGREIYERTHQSSKPTCSHQATEQHYCPGDNNLAVLAVVMLSIHSFLAGEALGLSGTFLVSVMIVIAILAHKWAASMALAIQINKSTLSVKTRVLLFLLFAVMSPLGILMGHHLRSMGDVHAYIQPICISLAAGTFIYLGTLHGLKQSVMVAKCCDIWRFNYVLLGFGLMAVVAVWV